MFRIESWPDSDDLYYEKISKEGIRITIDYHEQGRRVDAYTRIDAKGRGSEALEVLGERLQELANSQSRSVVHVALPHTRQGKLLLATNSRYKRKPDGSYERFFNPHPKDIALNMARRIGGLIRR